MQQRGVTTATGTSASSPNTSMESSDSIDIDDSNLMQQSTRGRNLNNSKLKVLVRSHAMREETSPPRDPQSPPSSTAQQQATATSPCIKLTPSTDSYPSSPTRAVGHGLSPSLSRSASPTSTLVPSPSPTHLAALEQSEFTLQEQQQHALYVQEPNKVNKLNKQNARKKNYIPSTCESGSNGLSKCECLNNNNNFQNNNNTLMVNNRLSGNNHRGKLRQQSSSLGSYDGSSPSLSRDNSSEQYTDTTGVDLEMFIPETLNRNSKDRVLMLRIEEELVQLAKDKNKTHFKFPPMSSYQRMLVHRCAAYFGMDHNIESSGKCVVVNKTKSTRIPDVEFKQHIKDEYTEEPRRSILKRDCNSIEDYNFKSPDRQYSLESRRSKSFEEREEEYEKARRRIFNKGNHDCSNEDIAWADEIAWSNSENDTKYRHHSEYQHHNHHYHHHRSSRLLKVQSEDPGEETLRPHVAKSYSFGGYGGALTRGDSMMSTHSAGPRLFTKQDSSASSVSWRLSPSSSGYKTQSQRSESITPSPTSTPFYSSNDSAANRQDSTATNASDIPPISIDDDNQQVVWAVTNIQNVPKGSVIIDPQTCQPIKNQDGSLYHHDPDNPLPELPQVQETKSPTHSEHGNNPCDSTTACNSEMIVENVETQPTACSTSSVSTKPPLSPVKYKPKDRPTSPKKSIKKTNSATSPSLPYTPPLSLTSLPSLPNLSTIAAVPSMPVTTQLVQSKSFPCYNPDQSGQQSAALLQTPNQYYGPTTYDYSQPCIVYAPYGQVPVGYDTRIETTQLQELPPQTYYVDSNQQITYQAPPNPSNVWPQTQYAIYSNTQPRYAAVPVQSVQQQGAFIAPYTTPSTGFMQQQTQNGQCTSTTEMIPVYPPQPVMYPAQTSNVYPNPNVIYAQPGAQFTNTTVYPAPPPPPPPPPPAHNMTYPVNVPTPNSVYQMEQMVQGVAQMQMHAHSHGVKDSERRFGTPKGKARAFSSSQSSTENSSPATAVMAYCTAGSGGAVFHRQNSETPPSLPATPGYGGSFPPMFIRQMSNVRASPPINRASRSPTPAAATPTMAGPPMGVVDMIAGEPRQRYPMPPFVYQTMPYTIPPDTRLVSGRGQPNAYRQQSPRPQYNNQYQPHQHNNVSNNSNSNSNASFGTAAAQFKNRKNRSSKPTNMQYSNNKRQSPN